MMVTSPGNRTPAPASSPTDPNAVERTYEWDLDGLEDRLDEFLAVCVGADAALVRAIVTSHAALCDQLGPRYRSARETAGPLLVAIRALEDALLLAIGGESNTVRLRRVQRNAAALIVVTGNATTNSEQVLRDVGAVGDALERTLQEFVPKWQAARTRREEAALYDTLALLLSPLLLRAAAPGSPESRKLISAAVRACLKPGHERRPVGERWKYIAALMSAGGVETNGDSLKVAVSKHRKAVPGRRPPKA